MARSHLQDTTREAQLQIVLDMLKSGDLTPLWKLWRDAAAGKETGMSNAHPAPAPGPADAVSEAEVEAAASTLWNSLDLSNHTVDGVRRAARACLEAAQRARKG